MSVDREPRAFGYPRASTKKQVESPETQKDIIRGYAEYQRGLRDKLGNPVFPQGDVTYFVDSSKSGKIPWEDRDAGREMFKQLRAGDHVIITKLDRAFRKLSDCVVVLEKFERLGVKLHVCNLMGGAIDLSSPMGRFLIHILAAFAELERAFISERTKDGLAKRKTKGVAHTRHPGYGFKWKKVNIEGKWTKVRERDDDERNVMRSILTWRMQDQPLGWDEIRQHLTYNLNLKTKDGKPWTTERIRRVCEAELKLQLREQRGNR